MASAAAHDGDDGDRKESDKRREFAFGGVSAARFANFVDGRKAAGIRGGCRRQEPADATHLVDLNHAVRLDHMVYAADDDGGRGREKKPRVRSDVHTAPERRDVAFAGVDVESSVNVAGVGVVGRKVGDGAHRRARAPERREVEDDIFGDENRRIKADIKAHGQLPAPGSGKAYAGDQEAASTSSPKPFGNPILPRHPKAAEAAAPSAFAGHPRQEDGGVDLYRLGLEAAMAMDDETILSEVARHVGVEVHQQQQQRPQRRPTRQKKAPAAMRAPAFTLRLSDEEAMEDVAAVSLVKVKDVNAEAAPVSRSGKRRRG